MKGDKEGGDIRSHNGGRLSENVGRANDGSLGPVITFLEKVG